MTRVGIVLMAVALLAGSAVADMTTVDVGADVRVWRNNVNTNYQTFHRTDTRLRNGSMDMFGFMKFDLDMGWLQGLGSANIISATFKGNGWSIVDPPTNPNDEIALDLITEGDWAEDQVTWNSRLTGVPWATPGVPVGDNYISATWDPGVAWEQDATDMVKAWAGGAPNYGVYAYRTGFSGTVDTIYASFWSRDAEANPGTYPDAMAPDLVIEYVPEPMTLGLLAVGAVAVIRRRR